MNSKMQKFSLLTALLGALFLSLSACTSDDEREYNAPTSNAEGLIPVRINIGGIESNPAPASRVAAKDGEATLIPISEAQTRTTMLTNVKYRVFVFDSSDECVAYKEIKAGSESDTSNQLELESGTYSFFAYSYNSTADMPTYSDPTGKSITDNAFKLSVSPLVDKGGGDLLYAKNIGVDISSASATVTLTFSHKFNLIEPVGVIKVLSAGTIFYVDGATTPFYQSADANIVSATVTELTGTVPSYETATLTFDTSSTTAATTTLTKPTNLTTAPVTATSTNGTSITNYGTNVAYLPSGSQNISLIISAAKYNNAGATTAATALPATCIFSGSTVSLGTAYELDFNFVQGAVYWAKGNLKYNSGTQTWSFYDTPFEADSNMSIDLFEWNTLVPNTSLASTNQNGNPWITSADPCSKVSSTRTWRTPAYEECNVLKAMFAATPSQSSWDTTKKGRWFGDTQNTGKTSVYLFLPAAGYSSSGYVGIRGYYWSSTPNSGIHAYSLYFNSTYVNVSDNYGGSISARSVRCVSDSK
jgi:uncharacterized protein (TIGR02145 family)